MILGLLVISMLGVVSAYTSAYTLVAGKIYDENGIKVEGAEVIINCNENIQNMTSNSEGDYAVQYLEADCNVGDSLFVTAEKDDSYGSKQGTIIENVMGSWNVAIINVTIPEFGFFVGVLTLMGALGVFFFVRKE